MYVAPLRSTWRGLLSHRHLLHSIDCNSFNTFKIRTWCELACIASSCCQHTILKEDREERVDGVGSMG